MVIPLCLLVWCPQGSSKLQCMLEFPSLWLLFLHLSACGHSGCYFLLVTFNSGAHKHECKCLSKVLMSTLLCVYLKMESLDHMEVISLIYWEITKHILQGDTALCSHQTVNPPVPSLVLNTVCPPAKFNFLVAFICFSQRCITLRMFSSAYCPCADPAQRHDSASLSAISVGRLLLLWTLLCGDRNESFIFKLFLHWSYLLHVCLYHMAHNKLYGGASESACLSRLRT